MFLQQVNFDSHFIQDGPHSQQILAGTEKALTLSVLLYLNVLR